MLKRVSCMAMALILLAALLVPSLAVMAASPVTATYTPAFNVTSALPGGEVTLSVNMKLSESCVLSGMRMILEFDKDCLTYKDKSAVMRHSAFTDATIFFKESENKIIVVWTSEDKIKLPTSFELMTVPFTVAANAEAGTTPVSVTMVELYTSSVYDGELSINNLNLAGDASTNLHILALDPAVKNVVTLISSIGQVSYPQSEDAIVAAEKAYAELEPEKQEQVTNYPTLQAARATYDKLAADALAAAALEQELAAYKAANKTALELNTTTINAATSTEQIAMLDAVNKAIEEYKALSAEAQFTLYKEKNNLQAYKTLLEKLAADALEAAKQEQYKQEAQTYVDQFRIDHVYILGMTTETVKSFDDVTLSKARNEYEALILLPDIGIYIEEGLKPEYDLMVALAERIAELKAAENPEKSEEILAAEEWKNKFASVLALDPETLTYEDAFDVQLAKALYDMLDPAAQALLTEEAALLEVLYEKSLTLSPEELVVEVLVDRVVEVNVPGQNVIVNKETPVGGILNLGVNTRNIGMFIWILLALALLSTMIFVALRIFWNILVRKETKANV